MTILHILLGRFGTGATIPAMLAVVLVSACAGVPPRLEAPSPASVSALDRYNRHPCTPTVASALDAYHVQPGSVRDLFYTQRMSNETDESRIIGYTAWMHLTDQPGSLVVDVDEECRFQQAYTRDGANLAGVYRSVL